jgi:hypothetical protein
VKEEEEEEVEEEEEEEEEWYIDEERIGVAVTKYGNLISLKYMTLSTVL